MSLLEVVNAHDEVIGIKPRAEIHAQGLLHREIYIWIALANGDLLFQRRGPTKDMFPNMLDCSVGGHVEIGHSYLKTALKELEEETGLTCAPSDLVDLGKHTFTETDNGKTNTAIRAFYVYRWNGTLNDLKIEEGEGAGFIALPLQKALEGHSLQNPGDFKPCFFFEEYQPIWHAIQAHLQPSTPNC